MEFIWDVDIYILAHSLVRQMAKGNSQFDDKLQAAIAAVKEVKSGMRLGLGSGSTVNKFVEELGRRKYPAPVTCASLATECLAKKSGLKVASFADMFSPSKGKMPQDSALDLYVDGADEVDKAFNLIKGGGGALTREKVLASAAMQFVCIVDSSKVVKKLGKFPLPIEVVPFAEPFVRFELEELGANVKKRPGFETDNGNVILDASGLQISDPLQTETELNNIAGIVENGIFSVRQPERVIVGAAGKAKYL